MTTAAASNSSPTGAAPARASHRNGGRSSAGNGGGRRKPRGSRAKFVVVPNGRTARSKKDSPPTSPNRSPDRLRAEPASERSTTPTSTPPPRRKTLKEITPAAPAINARPAAVEEDHDAAAAEPLASTDPKTETQPQPPTAHREILRATQFVARTLARAVGEEHSASVGAALAEALASRYASHWHVDEPDRGSGFRCLESSPGRLDKVLGAALVAGGIKPGTAAMAAAVSTLEVLTLWIDPAEVSMRCGDDGGITTLYTASSAAAATTTRDEQPAYRPRSCSSPPPPAPRGRSLSPTARPFAPLFGPSSPPRETAAAAAAAKAVPAAASSPPRQRRARNISPIGCGRHRSRILQTPGPSSSAVTIPVA